MKNQFSTIITVIFVGLTRAVFAQSDMTPQEARQTLEQFAKPQPSYINPEQAAQLFRFHGKVNVTEGALWKDDKVISNLSVKPEDQSFGGISINVAKGGAILNQIETLAKAWAKSPAMQDSSNPFTPIILSNGAKGYYDGNGMIVVSSPDGQFDILVDIKTSEDRKCPTATQSNKDLIEGLKDKEHGLQFLTDVVNKIYPLVQQKVQDRAKMRIKLTAAKAAFAKQSKPSPSENPQHTTQ